MRRAAFSIAVWGVYMTAVGLGLFLIPNILLPIFGLPAATDVWIRVFGLLLTLFGACYFYCARGNVVPFFRFTIPGRIVFAAGNAALVVFGLSSQALILFGVIDVAGALWTWWSLRTAAGERSKGNEQIGL